MFLWELKVLSYSKFIIFSPFLLGISPSVQEYLVEAYLSFRIMVSPSLVHNLLADEAGNNYERVNVRLTFGYKILLNFFMMPCLGLHLDGIVLI